jgi:hypothetical protein
LRLELRELRARLEAGLFHIDRAELGELADDLGDAGLVR